LQVAWSVNGIVRDDEKWPLRLPQPLDKPIGAWDELCATHQNAIHIHKV
jgi:hypothetical protein